MFTCKTLCWVLTLKLLSFEKILNLTLLFILFPFPFPVITRLKFPFPSHGIFKFPFPSRITGMWLSISFPVPGSQKALPAHTWHLPPAPGRGEVYAATGPFPNATPTEPQLKTSIPQSAEISSSGWHIKVHITFTSTYATEFPRSENWYNWNCCDN